MFKAVGSFIVVRRSGVHWEVLTSRPFAHWQRNAARCTDSEDWAALARRTFGPDAFDAIPAWLPGMLEATAAHYDGEHRDAVRDFAALIATGEPFGVDSDGRPNGGSHDRITPQPDRKPPGGNRVKVPESALTF